MSRALVVYYSRTGTTRRVANEIRDLVNGDMDEIVEAENHAGAFGWVRSIAEAVLRLQPRLQAPVCDPRGYDLVFVGGPIWMGRLAPAVRAWIACSGPSITRIAFFATQNGPAVAAAWQDLERLAGVRAVASHSVRMRAVPETVRQAELARFVARAQRAHTNTFDTGATHPHAPAAHG